MLFGLLARELHKTPREVGEMEWWECEDVFADMRERPSVQAMVAAYLGVKGSRPKRATRKAVEELIALTGQRG